MKYRRTYARQMTEYFRSMIEAGEIPTFSGAAEELSVDRGTLERFRREEPEFAEAFRECRALFADCLIEGGLKKRFDSSLVRHLLSEQEREIAEEREADGGANRLEVLIRVVS